MKNISSKFLAPLIVSSSLALGGCVCKLQNQNVHDLELYSGKEMIKCFDSVQVIYSNRNQVEFIAKDGSHHYWSGDYLMTTLPK